ncbi:Sua5/YciO/YrdC/YwlC family protein [Candidatus Mycoplasma haematominutum]|uniref:YrdC-like domain-containing protein n=1 Tax=Candidatus Mycoplasma haematominutum 'Birmingham 1' TaxID=1116213 RepID=G8C2H4_9MOLU|nr:Sua5/YciO/YrdC/YwlC family protein [Candidatus Mycoplasma haematominutum]CCE66522.1 conserved hypothetical protein (putative translation factor, SUA5 domain or ribosome maturation factor) [Candidatus Mycoplasma haematominutum 'Birmingham 1']
MPKNELILGVVKKIGPVYSSSANISNQKPIGNIGEACLTFIDHLGKFLMVRSACKSSGIPSTVYDYDNKRILREGEIPHWRIFS